MSLSFPKEEKLKSRKVIDQLFREGKSVTKYPLRIIYLQIEGMERHKAAFAVPKRSFKLAVNRNRIKRQLREAYRLHKNELITNKKGNFALLVLYVSKEEATWEAINSSMIALLQNLQK